MGEITNNIIATIIGGLLLTLILFLFNEYIFPKNNLTGQWIVTVSPRKTSYNSYIGMKIIFKFHLLQQGYILSGSGEKIKDINPDGSEIKYENDKRVTVNIEGYFERKYFKKSKVYLNIDEGGSIRKSRTTYFLEVNKINKLSGNFISTVADSTGEVEMIKA